VGGLAVQASGSNFAVWWRGRGRRRCPL